MNFPTTSFSLSKIAARIPAIDIAIFTEYT